MQPYDVVVVLGTSVNEARRRIFEQRVGRCLRVHSGSTKKRCELCGADVWIGPRAMTMAATSVVAFIACETCIAAKMGQDGAFVDIVSLGNPEGEVDAS